SRGVVQDLAIRDRWAALIAVDSAAAAEGGIGGDRAAHDHGSAVGLAGESAAKVIGGDIALNHTVDDRWAALVTVNTPAHSDRSTCVAVA
ncbi:MAG: hypothetical protein QF569_29545, partial [Candidatus Poribacteria bacterium]|nr:hypothetical protein [Candidatus Poribacteria bacterium]